MVIATREFDAAKRARLDRLRYRGEDRRLPFSGQLQAEFASANVLNNGLDGSKLEELARKLIEAFFIGKRTNIWREFRQLAKQMRRDQAQATNAALLRFDGTLNSIEALLSPRGKSEVMDAIQRALKLSDRVTFVNELGKTRTDFKAALIDLDVSKLGQALVGGPIDPAWQAQLLATAWKQRAIHVAHQRVTALAAVVQQPNGYTIAITPSWPSSGSLFLQTVTGPALLLQRLQGLAEQGRFDGLDDSELVERLVEYGITPDEAARQLLHHANDVLPRITVEARTGMTVHGLNCLRHFSEGCRDAALLSKGDMKQDGLDREEPIARMIGLTCAESVAFVADQLHLSCKTIDAWSLDLIATGSMRKFRASPASEKEVGILANILSHEAQPGRYSSGRRGIRDPEIYDPLDPKHFPMRHAVASMREKLQSRTLRDRLIKSFGIDPRDLLAGA